MLTKDDCTAYLIHRGHRASDWRTLQAHKFPNDKRNAQAAERLQALMADADIPDQLWSVIGPYYDETCPKWLDAVSDTNRDVAFRKQPKNFSAYLQNLISNLTH